MADKRPEAAKGRLCCNQGTGFGVIPEPTCTTPMRTNRFPALITLGLGATMLFSAGCMHIASDHRIPDGSTTARSYTSVAGDIDVGRNAKVRNLDTVAGDIDVGRGSRVGSLDSVAGDIRVGEEVTVDGSIETVAGDIEIERGCTITGGIDTVAGDISIAESVVKGGITLRHGSLDLQRTRVDGTVRVKWSKDTDTDTPRITIGLGSEVP
jgi:acyl-[acyl carrier protein]--UDP-N-acetylglucosamine O-acyltransferase